MEWGEGNNVGWLPYDQSFREDAHQLLAWGYQDSRRLITPDCEETEITGFIVEAIRAKLNSPQTDERFERYSSPMEDNPVSGEGRTGKSRMRIDIIIEATRPKPRPRYIFEAKRLRRPSHGISKYVGNEGMMRFISDRYAADCPEVVMVGYMQTDAAAHWVVELEKQFSKSSTKQFRLIDKLTKVSIISDFVDEWSSSHRRLSGTPIVIFHLLLDCSEMTG